MIALYYGLILFLIGVGVGIVLTCLCVARWQKGKIR